TPSVVAQVLDRLLRRKGPYGEDLLRSTQGVRGDVRADALDHTLREQDEGDDDRERQQDVEGRARHVDVEVADRLDRPTRDATEEGHGHGDTDGGGQEVV